MDNAAIIAKFPGYATMDPNAIQADYKSTGGAGKGGGGTGGSGGGINFSFPDIKLSDVGGSAVDFAKGLDTNVNNAFSSYADYVKNLQNPLDIYTGLESAAGVPTLRKTATTLSGQVNDLEDTIRKVEGNVSGRSMNSLMTQSQRDNLITETKRPLVDNLGWLGQSLGRVMQGIDQAESGIATKTGLAVQGQDRISDVYKQKVSLASESAARQMTGFTADRQDRLSILLAKLQSQQQLATTEWQEANDLVKQQKDFEFRKNEMDTQIANNTQVIEANGRKYLINSSSGQKISDLGSVKDPSTGNGSTDITKYLQSLNNGATNASDWEYSEA